MIYHDIVHCSYDLGPGFHNRLLHTKELSQTCSCYWISPSGELYEVDYTGTQDFCDDDDMPYKYNGNHGKVKPVSICTTLKLQPAKWDAYYAKCPTCIVTFMAGKIIHHKVI